MRVLYHTSASVIGGGETVLKYLIGVLPPGITPIITYDRPELREFIESIGIESRLTISPNQLFFALQEIRPDVVQFYHSASFVRAIRRVPKLFKVIETVHNRHGFTGDCMSYTKALNDITVCVSPDAEAYVHSVDADVRTMVIPNGIDTGIFKPGPKRPQREKPLGGFTGRLEQQHWKGIPQLLEIVAGLPVNFELVGKDFGGYSKCLPENVKHVPYTPDVSKYYHSWDFFLSCSPSESFGLSIAEALACGLPSVIYNCGGICHYLENGKHAVIVGSYAQMAEAIMRLPELSLEPTSIDFSAKKMASSYAELYKDLVGSHIEIDTSKDIDRMAVVPKGWYGVRRALKPLTECEVDPTTHEAVRQIRARKPKLLVLGCYFPAWQPVLDEARRVGAKVVCTWHASFILNEFDKINRDGMAAMLQAYRKGFIHRIATPHRGFADVLTKCGYQADFLPNVVEELEPTEPLPGINIGLFGTGASWKNMECQLVAASLIPDAKIHVQQLQHTSVIKELGLMNRLVQHPNYIRSDEEYYKLIGSMTVNMVVSLSEVYSYYIAESMMMGVPVVATAITPLLKGAAWLEQTCTTPYFEDPIEIYNALARVIRDRETVRIKSMTHIRELNKQSKLIVEEAIKSWHEL